MKYSKACLCSKDQNDQNDATERCQDAFVAAFPTVQKKHLSPMFLCDRDKRDVHYSDDLTEEDFKLFRQTPQLRPRFRRAVQNGYISKENATRYCAARISETKIGKLCAKVGVDIQALVKTCAVDLEVSKQASNLVFIYSSRFMKYYFVLSFVVHRKYTTTYFILHLIK